MRPLLALVIYFMVVFVGGALFAPWLYWFGQHVMHGFPKITDAAFYRYLDRSFLILALAGIWPLLRALGARSVRDLGVTPPYGQSRKFFGGLLLGFFSLAFVAGIAIAFGGRVFMPDLTAHKVVDAVFSAVVAAAIVAVLEEILFRGGIFGGLRRVIYWPFALFTTSLLWALVHFFQRADIAGQIGWNSGLVLLPRIFDFQTFVPEFFTLTLAGVVLGLAYQRTGNLYLSIGLHAGWVFWEKIYASFTAAAPNAAIWLWGGSKMIDGWLAFLVLVATLMIVKFLPLEKRSPFTISS